MSFMDTFGGIVKGFATGGIGGAITGGLSANAQGKEQHTENLAATDAKYIDRSSLDIARKKTVEGIQQDWLDLENGLAQAGNGDSTTAKEARLKLQRDSEQRMQAIEGAQRKFENGQNVAEVQRDLDKALTRYGYIGQGVQAAMAVAGGVAGAMGGAGAAAANPTSAGPMGGATNPFMAATGGGSPFANNIPTGVTGIGGGGGIGQSGMLKTIGSLAANGTGYQTPYTRRQYNPVPYNY